MKINIGIIDLAAKAIYNDIIHESDSNNRIVVTKTQFGKFITQFTDEIGGPGIRADVHLFNKLVYSVKTDDRMMLLNDHFKAASINRIASSIAGILFHCMFEAQAINSIITELWNQGNGSVKLLNGLTLGIQVVHRPGAERSFTLSDGEDSLVSMGVYFGDTERIIDQIKFRWIPHWKFSDSNYSFEFDLVWEKYSKNFGSDLKR